MLRNVFDHVFRILVEQWVVFYYQEGVVVLFQYRHELEAGECSANIQFGDIAIQAAEDARIVPADEEYFVSLKVEIGIDGIYQQLRRGDQDVEGVFL